MMLQVGRDHECPSHGNWKAQCGPQALGQWAHRQLPGPRAAPALSTLHLLDSGLALAFVPRGLRIRPRVFRLCVVHLPGGHSGVNSGMAGCQGRN